MNHQEKMKPTRIPWTDEMRAQVAACVASINLRASEKFSEIDYVKKMDEAQGKNWSISPKQCALLDRIHAQRVLGTSDDRK